MKHSLLGMSLSEIYNIMSLMWHFRPNLLYIENPEAPDQDMGRNSFQIVKIRRAFEHAHQLMTSSLGDPKVASYLSYVIRPDDPALADRPGPELNDSRSNKAALK